MKKSSSDLLMMAALGAAAYLLFKDKVQLPTPGGSSGGVNIGETIINLPGNLLGGGGGTTVIPLPGVNIPKPDNLPFEIPQSITDEFNKLRGQIGGLGKENLDLKGELDKLLGGGLKGAGAGLPTIPGLTKPSTPDVPFFHSIGDFLGLNKPIGEQLGFKAGQTLPEAWTELVTSWQGGSLGPVGRWLFNVGDTSMLTQRTKDILAGKYGGGNTGGSQGYGGVNRWKYLEPPFAGELSRRAHTWRVVTQRGHDYVAGVGVPSTFKPGKVYDATQAAQVFAAHPDW